MPQKSQNLAPKRRSRRLIEARSSQKISQLVRDSLNATKRTARCAILSLPMEILLAITSYLPIPWRLSFVLTCKGFTAIVFPNNTVPRLDTEDRIDFLSTLQKDLPNTYFCFCCDNLRPLNCNLDWIGQDHRWTIGYFENPTWHMEKYSTCHIRMSEFYFCHIDDFRIDFMEAYLVMNRHLFVDSHGLSLQSLERHASFEEVLELDKCYHSVHQLDRCCHNLYKPEAQDCAQLEAQVTENQARKRQKEDEIPWRVSLQSTPKIIDDKLYLARFYTIVGPLVPWEQLARLIVSFSPAICCHLQCSVKSFPQLPECLDYQSQAYDDRSLLIRSCLPYNKEDGQPFEFSPESDSCMLCNTDYDISLNQEIEKGEWNFSLSTYHCLGSCRSPDDKYWDYLVNHMDRRELGIQHFFTNDLEEREELLPKLKSRVLELDRGGVRRKWHESNTTSEKV